MVGKARRRRRGGWAAGRAEVSVAVARPALSGCPDRGLSGGRAGGRRPMVASGTAPGR